MSSRNVLKLSSFHNVAIQFEILREKQLPQGKGKVLHSFMMATDPSLNYQQNVEVMDFMEAEVLRLAQSKGFAGIFTTNTSPLTQVCLVHHTTNISCNTTSHFYNVSLNPPKKFFHILYKPEYKVRSCLKIATQKSRSHLICKVL